jgi:DNA replication protein DnaC
MSSPTFRQDVRHVNFYLDKLNETKSFSVVNAQNTVAAAELLTYCAICQNWKGSQLHCTVYNLRYSQYLDMLKQSWNTKVESEELEYTRIWAGSARVLIISNLDYVSFGDFESQTLLNLIQSRSKPEQKTLIVIPDVSNLVGKGSFFDLLKRKLRGEGGDTVG